MTDPLATRLSSKVALGSYNRILTSDQVFIFEYMLTNLSKNSWIECVKRLSRFLATAKKPKGMRRVKVAIIDDGVDASMSELDGRIAAGKSFSPYANSKDLMSPYFVSSSNHGTCMALLICELCPEVELYVAKLDQREVIGSNQRHITTTSAVEVSISSDEETPIAI